MSWSQQDLSFKKLSNKRVTTSTGKGLPEEKGASTLELYLPDIKTENIPGTGNTATGLNGVLYYYGPTASFGQTLVVDTSVPGNLTWFASSGYGNTTTANDGSAISESQRLFNWVSDKYDAFGTVSGAGYEIKLYDNAGNLITKSDASNWLFDYQTGILMFNNATLSNGNPVSTSGPYKIVGWRYVGQKGIIPAYYGGSGYTTYTKGDLLVGAGGTFIKLNVGSDNYVLSADSSTSTGLKWVVNTGSGGSGISYLNNLTAGVQYFAVGTSGSLFNIASSGSTHTFNIPIAGSGATGLVSTDAQTFAGQKTFTSAIIGNLTGTATTAGFATTALTAQGILSSITGQAVDLNIGLISGTALSYNGNLYYNPASGRLAAVSYTGSWAGSTITGLYGGTGYTAYTKGDILVGAGGTFIKLGVGSDNTVLTASSSSATGLTWSPTAATGITTLNTLTTTTQFFSTGTSGSGFNISSSGSTHTFNIPIAGTGATGLVSTLAQTFAGAKTFTGDVVITSSTASTYMANGALTVNGGVGISGQLSVNQVAMGYTGIATNPVMAFIGSTNSAPITMTVLSDGSLLWEGSSGKLFGINNNLSSGWIFNVGDISGLPIIRANADGTIAMAEFAANVGIGLSNPSYKLHVVGDTNLSSGYVYRINGTSVLSATQVLGLTVSSGNITSGAWSGTAISVPYGGTGLTTYTVGDILYASGTTTIGRLTAGTAGSVLISAGAGATPYYSSTALLVSGNATTAANINIVATTTGTLYPLFSNTSSTASGIGVSVDSAISYNASTDTLTAGKFSGLASGTAATFTNFYGTLSGNVTGTSTTSQNVNIVSASTGTFYPLFSNISSTASGVAISVDSGLSWNSATDTLTSGTFSGNLSATAATAINFYGSFVGSATSAANINVVLAATNASHQVLFTPTSGSASGVAVSTENSFVYNPSTDILSVSGLAVTSSTSSTNTTTGALIVTGGVGIGGSVNVGGRVGIGTNLLNAALNVQIPSTTSSGIILRGNGSQTSDAITYFGAAGNTQYAVDANGRVRLTGMDGIWSNKVQQNIFDVSDGRINFNLTTWQYSSIYWVTAGSTIGQASNQLQISNNGTTSITGVGVLANGWSTGGGNRAFGIVSPSGSERTYFNGYGNLVINPNNPNPLHDAWNQMHLLSMDISGTANTYIGNIILGKVEGTERFSVGPFGNTRITVGSATTATGLLVKAVASQSGNIIETQASTGVTNFYVSPTGGASFSDNVEIKSAKEVRFNNSGNTFYTGFKAGSNASNTTYTLPIAFPGSGTSILQSDTSGTLTWTGIVGNATTALNINIVAANSNSAHQLVFTPTSGSGSGVAVSSRTTLNFNPSTDILSVSGLAVTATTSSTNSSTGALIVTGGVGIGGTVYTATDLNVGTSTTGRLYFSQATLGSAGTTVIPSMAFIGTTNSPITLSVLADNSLSFDGSSGQLFSINNNLSTGWIFAVNDISGLPLIRANADGTVAMGEFAGNIGIGISNPSYKLHVVGDTNLSSGYVYRINGTSVLSASSLGTGVTNSSLTAVGTITTGTWAGSTITGLYGGTGYTNYTSGDILVGAGGTFIKLNAGSSNYVLTSNGTGTIPSWQAIPPSAASSVAVSPTTTNSSFSITAVNSANGSGLGLSTIASFVVNPFTGIVSVSGLAVTASTTSTSSSTGALIVTGGVGIGQTLFTSSSYASSISGVVLSNGVITSGSWAGSTLTAFYGGTGYNSYTKGDILVGAGSTFIKLNVGTDNYVLTASSSSATGLTWSPTSATGITSLNSLTATQQYFSTGTSGSGFNISSTGSTHTFNIPIAGSGVTGLITGIAQTIAGQKTFTSAIIGDLTGTATTAGFATTANYAYQSGYGTTSGFATTAANLNVSNASTGTFYPVLSNTASSTSGIGASVNSYFSFNAATGAFGATSVNILTGQSYSIGGNNVLSATSLGTGVTNSSLTALGTITTGTWAGSTITGLYGGTGYSTYTKGDLLVGAGGTFVKFAVGTNNYVLAATSASGSGLTWRTASSATATSSVAPSNPLSGDFWYDSSDGSLSVYYNDGDTSQWVEIAGAFTGNVYSGNIYNIPYYNATGLGITGSTSFTNVGTGISILYTTGSTSTSSGALVVSGGVGIGGSIYTSSSYAASISGVVFNNSVVTSGSWAGSTITGLYGGTGYSSYTKGDILVGAGSTFIKLSVGTDNYILSASSTSATGLSWIANTGGGGAGTVYNGSLYAIPYYPAAGTAITGSSSFTNTGTSINIGYSTAATNTATGALTVVGGVGIGQTLFTSSSYASSISGVVLNNGIITSGTWAGSTITGFYGGTGYNSYNNGDILVGAGSTFIKVGSGSTNYVLSSNAMYPAGVGWTWVSAVGVGTNPPSATHDSDLWWNSNDGSLNFYYNDGDTSQWVEIAGGSGIDLSQPVHITSTVGSTNVSTGALIVDGGVGIQGELHTASLVINGTYDVVGTSVTLSTTTAGQPIFSLDASVYRSVKFMVQISRGSDFQVQEILLLHDATDTYLTQYAQLLSGNDLVLATYDADLNSGNIRLLVTPFYTNTTFKIYGTAVRN